MANGVSATTTYGYDAFGSRVLQTGTSTTTFYPFKWYSVASSTGSGAKYATTTEYVFNGDTLLSTIDQQFASGNATGSAQTRYVHPDHLGSTNVVTNASGTVVQTLDYYPFGATRISTNVGGADSARKYIGQFSDQSNLQYLNARYYSPSQGQFISEDPIFLLLGSPEAEKRANRSLRDILSDPQGLNSYSYAKNNPITIKDPSGLISSNTATILGLYAQVLNLLSQLIVQMGGGGSAGNPAPASTAMLARSTTINPQPLNITSSNQRYYGNVINQIQKSSDFTNYVADKVNRQAKNGVIDVPVTDPSNSFTFSQGDLKTALHNVNAGLSGKQSSNGTWNIKVTISDTYNFEPNNYGNSYSKAAISTLNNAAVLGQAAGVVSPYPVSIGFDYSYKP
ncbi:hypothetical protein XI03_11365 [Bradyrhizobium sp. CCBAU 65884]|nr:hypothetical protein [Bradyrhizobium sp. CCBAU 65884]